MSVNFTGLSNIYGVKINVQRISPTEPELKDVSARTYMNLRLTDDALGEDFSEMRRMLETTDLRNKTNPIYPQFLNIVAFNNTMENDYTLRKTQTLFINDVVPININDKNLKFFTYLASLLKRIQDIPQHRIIVDNAFLQGDITQHALFLDKTNKPDIRQFIPAIFTKENINIRAKEIGDALHSRMLTYFKI